MRDFAEQTVVITGAASGLGQAIVRRFVDLKARVYAVDLDTARLTELQTALNGAIEPVVCDVTDLPMVERALSPIPADVLINSAGITGKTNLRSYEVDPANVELVFRVNFFGSYHTSRALLPGMVERGYGRVLHIASIAGKEGNAGMLAYSASKAAVIGMAKVQGKELAETGVTVNAIAPAVIRTPLVDAMPVEQVRYMTDKIPMKRTGSLDELVDMVQFIVSPQASFTTAFTFDLTGGRATY
ncbi:MAG: SDR family oxidoreductase [Chloroflexi bacterium]|uniref:SDR family NAD(P)-dependent oxidoreductase n=1 Tax=Candidatus Flexifilum breve TaxID=3140694 RepID=UPI003134E2E3|nr:SDR family oxidoreductase [Chloroflexota bacterium]